MIWDGPSDDGIGTGWILSVGGGTLSVLGSDIHVVLIPELLWLMEWASGRSGALSVDVTARWQMWDDISVVGEAEDVDAASGLLEEGDSGVVGDAGLSIGDQIHGLGRVIVVENIQGSNVGGSSSERVSDDQNLEVWILGDDLGGSREESDVTKALVISAESGAGLEAEVVSDDTGGCVVEHSGEIVDPIADVAWVGSLESNGDGLLLDVVGDESEGIGLLDVPDTGDGEAVLDRSADGGELPALEGGLGAVGGGSIEDARSADGIGVLGGGASSGEEEEDRD